MSNALATGKGSIIDRMRQRAAQDAAAQASNSYPPFIKIKEVATKGRQETQVAITFPDVVGEDGKKLTKTNPEVSGVLIAYQHYREVRYRDGAGQWKSECFSLGTNKEGTGVGNFHGGTMACSACKANWENFDTSREVTQIDGTVERDMIKCKSKTVGVFLLDPAYWENDKPTLAMMHLPPSSVWGIMIKDRDIAEMRAATLLAYPDKSQGEHKGVLHQLQSRPWELIGDPITPYNAIWMTIFGSWLGTPKAVPAFDLGDELNEEEIGWVDSVEEEANQMLIDWAAQNYRYAHDRIPLGKAQQLAEFALANKYDALSDNAVAALPVSVEGPTDGVAPEVEPQQSVRAAQRVRPAPAPDDEFADYDE